jgi:hypothetical protein
MMIRIRSAAALCLAASLIVTTDHVRAVTLNPRGLGQVLIYPYYTINAGFSTLLSIVNTTAQGKSLKLRFHEGRNGRAVFNLNIYLSPFDVWVAQVYSSGDENSVAAIATNDLSCVVPAFLLPVDPGSGPPRANFSNSGYSGANADGGPADFARTREGYFDVIEMGEVTDAAQHTLTAITHDQNGVPATCAQVQAAWSAPGGYWGQNAQTDLTPPAGGLYGAESIINVAEGLMYTINATAIDGFSNAIQHTGPGDAAPDLNTASQNAAGTYSAFVAYGGRLLEADYAKPEDAISALLMADNVSNEYVVDPGVGAQSDWVQTAPTKRFYTDPPLLLAGATQADAPFDVIFGSALGGTSCGSVGSQFWSREELTTTTGVCFNGFCGQPPLPPALCYATSLLTIGSPSSSLGSRLVLKDLTEIDLFYQSIFKAGWLRLDFTTDNFGSYQSGHVLTSLNGLKLRGLPTIGFLALDYTNENVTPGVLANYSGAYPHRAHVTCVKNTDGSPCE